MLLPALLVRCQDLYSGTSFLSSCLTPDPGESELQGRRRVRREASSNDALKDKASGNHAQDTQLSLLLALVALKFLLQVPSYLFLYSSQQYVHVLSKVSFALSTRSSCFQPFPLYLQSPAGSSKQLSSKRCFQNQKTKVQTAAGSATETFKKWKGA